MVLSKYLDQKMERRIDRAMEVLPVVQMVMRLLILGLLLLVFRSSCDWLVDQAIKVGR